VSERGLRTLIVEDEWATRDDLVQLVEATGRAHVVAAIGTFQEAVEVLTDKPGGIDLAFVDVRLVGSEGNGLALVSRFAVASPAPAFVLSTALHHHALEAFELGVVDYVLKPYSLERIQRTIDRIAARRSIPESSNARVVARNRRNLVFVELDDVWAFESQERITLLHCERGVFDLDLSLAAIENAFGRRFVRVHRSWLVADRHIKELERAEGDSTLVVGVGLRVPVARDRAVVLRSQLVDDALGIRRR
jgi:two-component system, LytTR family, response regulator LytT